MNRFIKLLAGLMSAVMIAFCGVGVIPGSASDDDTSVSDEEKEEPVTTPIVLEQNGDVDYIMNAGTMVQLPVKFKEKKAGVFNSIRVYMTSASDELTISKDPSYISDLDGLASFYIRTKKTASEGKYDLNVTADILDEENEIISTQNFVMTMTVKSDLKPAALNMTSYNITKEIVKPGDEFQIDITLSNTTGVDVKNAEVELAGLDPGKFVVESGFTKQYVDIENGRKGTVHFTVLALKGIAYEREQLTLNLSYSLDEKKTELSRQVSSAIFIKCEPPVSGDNNEETSIGKNDLALINYSTSAAVVEENTVFDLSIELKNNGEKKINKARVSVLQLDGSKFSLESGLGYYDFDADPGQSKRFSFRLIGGSGISSVRESVPISLEFGGNSATAYAVVTCLPKQESEPASLNKNDLAVVGYAINKESVSVNSPFTLTVTLTNKSKEKIEKARIGIEADGSKFAADSGLLYNDFDIRAGETKAFSFSLIGCTGISSVREVIPITLEFGTISTTVHATVKCMPNDQAGTGEDGKKIFAPNIIIESYEFGGESVTAGQKFPLSLNIKNVSNDAVIENLKVTINGGASTIDGSMAFSPANSSNSFFFEKLDKQATETIEMDLLAKADAVPNSYPVNINFSYEYSVGKERFQASEVTETISIPLRQEDRLTINEPEVPNYAVSVGEMVSLSTSIVNKGKSSVYNVTAAIEGEGFAAETPSYYIGNINSGSEEYYDAKITPYMDGDIIGDLVFTYEDANGESKEKRIPFTFMAMSFNYDDMGFNDGGFFPDDEIMPEEEENGISWWIWAAAGSGAALIIVVIIVIVVKNKKKKAEAEADDEDL